MHSGRANSCCSPSRYREDQDADGRRLEEGSPKAKTVKRILPATFSQWDRAMREIPTERLEALTDPVVSLLGAVAGLVPQQMLAGARAQGRTGGTGMGKSAKLADWKSSSLRTAGRPRPTKRRPSSASRSMRSSACAPRGHAPASKRPRISPSSSRCGMAGSQGKTIGRHPLKLGSHGTYEWQSPEVALLASLVGQISQAAIAEVLTTRLRGKRNGRSRR